MKVNVIEPCHYFFLLVFSLQESSMGRLYSAQPSAMCSEGCFLASIQTLALTTKGKENHSFKSSPPPKKKKWVKNWHTNMGVMCSTSLSLISQRRLGTLIRSLYWAHIYLFTSICHSCTGKIVVGLGWSTVSCPKEASECEGVVDNLSWVGGKFLASSIFKCHVCCWSIAWYVNMHFGADVKCSFRWYL